MKKTNIFRSVLATTAVLSILIAGIVMNSCKKDSTTGGAMPSISNFRVVEKDSTITAGAFGLTMAVIGVIFRMYRRFGLTILRQI